MMKNSDLIIPFSFENRKPAMLGRFFLIPGFYDKHSEYGTLDCSQNGIFKNNNPINVEFCSGNGQWILEKAKNNPGINWVAVEMRFERARRIFVKMHNMGIDNLLVVFGDANDFINYYLPEKCISEAFVNFPDPWPKKKHIKNRLVTKDFMSRLSFLTKEKGKITIVTDDTPAKDWMLEAALSSGKWESVFPSPYYISEMEGYGGSYFDSLWREKNREIKYLQFINR